MFDLHAERIGSVAVIRCEGRMVQSDAVFKLRDAVIRERQVSAILLDFAYSGEGDQHSGVMSITIPADSDQAIGAKRRWQDDCVGSDRNRQEELIRSGDLGGGGKGRHLSPFSPRISV